MSAAGSFGGWGTFALGVTAALVARAAGPSLARRTRPLARSAIKQAILVAQGSRARAAELREDWEDLLAEAQEEARAGAAPAPSGAGSPGAPGAAPGAAPGPAGPSG